MVGIMTEKDDNNELPNEIKVDKTELNKSIVYLKKFVKESHIAGQNHLDVTLVDANERDKFYSNLSLVKNAIKQQVISEENFKSLLNL